MAGKITEEAADGAEESIKKALKETEQKLLPAPEAQKLLPAPEPKELASSQNKATDFYVGPTGPASTLPSTGYRYMRYLNDDWTVGEFVQQTLKSKKAPGSYFGFDSFNTGSAARDGFQIRGPIHGDSWSDARLKGYFDTLQLYDDIGIPNAIVPLSKGGKGTDLEPFTKSYPDYGKGGARQLYTDQILELNKIKKIPEE